MLRDGDIKEMERLIELFRLQGLKIIRKRGRLSGRPPLSLMVYRFDSGTGYNHPTPGLRGEENSMKELVNSDTSIKQGRKWYHIDDCGIPGIIHVKRNEHLDKSFNNNFFEGFNSVIQTGINRISCNPYHTANDRYITA